MKGYRKDLDLLKGISIIAVVLYHLRIRLNLSYMFSFAEAADYRLSECDFCSSLIPNNKPLLTCGI